MKIISSKPKPGAKIRVPKRQARAKQTRPAARRPAKALDQRMQELAPERKQERQEESKPREEPKNIAEKLETSDAYRKEERGYQGRRRDYDGREQDSQEEKKKFYQSAAHAHQSNPAAAYSDISSKAESRPYRSETSVHHLFLNASATLNDVLHKPEAKKHIAHGHSHSHNHGHHAHEPAAAKPYHKHEHHDHSHHRHSHDHSHNHAPKKDAADLLKMKQESYCPSHGYSCGSYHDNKRDAHMHVYNDLLGSQTDKPYCPSHGYTCGTTHASPVTLRFAKK